MFYTVYKLTNSINGKIYIGVHKTDNLDDGYMGSGKHLKRAQAKYGVDAFKKEYIQIFDNPEDMFNMESALVNEDFVKDKNTYNLKLGGEGGYDHVNSDPELKTKCAKLGREATDKILEERFGIEWRKELSKLAVDARTEETYKKAGQNAAKTILERYGHGSFYGKTHTDETKRKIGDATSKAQAGSGNSQYGTCWVHSLTEKLSKKIKKEDLEIYINNGWLQGRKMKF